MTTILIVDDSPVDRHFTRDLIEDQPGFQIVFAEHGLDALQLMRHSAPDLVITDLVMPEMDGLELVRASRREFPEIPVVLMTAYGNESLAVDALYEGAASYVPKAKRVERLVETVYRVLARARANRNRNRSTKFYGKVNATFYLDNDLDKIPALVDYVQQIIGGLELSDETEHIRVGVALEEALLHSIWHGNLELTSDELDRSRAAGWEALKELISQRRSQSPYRDRQIVLEVHVTNSTARFVIHDGGVGNQRLSARTFTREDYFGTGDGVGIALMSTLMDNVTYNETGNELTLIKVSQN
ncbi:response regulator [Stieleria sp. ICT_E10.1]|uniref:ATP-binding response regulator n=1 Tax=Stieleria sedimenti TaxID=2976331 RepID=UPI0021806F59|nr:response regulator [Stieleria sedimenti]MCS7467816.1 response regulator [Stieleria sedimenti]